MATSGLIEENKKIARRIPEEVVTMGNIDLVDELFSENAVEHDPFGDHHGRVAIRKSFGPIVPVFTDLSATVLEIIGEGDMVAMRVRLRGIHQGEFLGITPTGRSIETEAMVFTRIKAGKITERWVMIDTRNLMNQLT